MERNKFNKLKREEMQTTKVQYEDHLELRVKSMFIYKEKETKERKRGPENSRQEVNKMRRQI